MLCSVVPDCPTLCTPWMAARQAPASMDFSRQEYWHGLPFPFLGDPPDPGIKARFPTLQADSSLSEPPGKPFKCQCFSLKQTNFLCISPCFTVATHGKKNKKLCAISNQEMNKCKRMKLSINLGRSSVFFFFLICIYSFGCSES